MAHKKFKTLTAIDAAVPMKKGIQGSQGKCTRKNPSLKKSSQVKHPVNIGWVS